MSKDWLAKNKPEHVSPEVWRRHLVWMEVVGGEAATNAHRYAKEPRRDGRRVRSIR